MTTTLVRKFANWRYLPQPARLRGRINQNCVAVQGEIAELQNMLDIEVWALERRVSLRTWPWR